MELKEKLVKQFDNKVCDLILKIYNNSFPQSERIEFDEFFKNGYELYGYFDNGELVGFIACRKNQLFRVICYLAVDESKRNMNYGSAILDIFKNANKNRCIALNIENVYEKCPQNHIRLKRLNFYLKNGFSKSDLTFDWHADTFSTLYNGAFDVKAYVKFLLGIFPDCANFRILGSPATLGDINKVDIDNF